MVESLQTMCALQSTESIHDLTGQQWGLMSEQATAALDSSAGVIPAAPWRVKTLSVLPGLRLAVTFNDGRAGVVDFSAVKTSMKAGIHATLGEPEYFEKATLVMGTVTWPNGADLDPVWMYESLADAESWSVPEVSPHFHVTAQARCAWAVS